MDPILLSTVLTSLIPAGVDVVKSWFAKKNDGKPVVATAKEYAELVQADVAKLQALANMEKGEGSTYPWVNAAKQMQRPVVVAAVLLSWVAMALDTNVAPEKFEMVSVMASSVFFYLFGDRVNFYAKKRT